MNIAKAAVSLAAAALLIGNIPHIQTYASDEKLYTVSAPVDEENGVLTLENGEKWYKVNNFGDDTDNIITVTNSDGNEVILTAAKAYKSEYIWHYSRPTMVSSSSARRSTLSTDSFYLTCHNSALYNSVNWWTSGETTWNYSDSALSYNEDGAITYLKYAENSKPPFSCTSDATEAANVSIYSKGSRLSRCIAVQPTSPSYVLEGSGYAAPEFSVSLTSPDIIPDTVKWFIDGSEQSCAELTFTASPLAEKPAGVHRISCLIEGHDENGIHYREQSAEAAFVIAKGVVPDSLMTFSDIHEQYYLITDAIEHIMARTGGYIPSLVVCTGDFVNGPTPDADTMLDNYFPRIVPALGGLDAVYVAGNHDAGAAAALMSSAASLGADTPLSPLGGQIFRGSSDAVSANGKSSRFAKGITVYGLNYDAAEASGSGTTAKTYESAIGELEAFLKKTSQEYRGELVIISAHSGLHVLGLQPGSVNESGSQISRWAGENAYNIDRSADVVQLINSYASEYDMDIIYLFGHDHSRHETELIMTSGDTIISTDSYADRTSSSHTLAFTYAHSGYLSTEIGCADANFSFIYRSGDSYIHDLIGIDGKTRTTAIKANSTYKEPPAQTTSAAPTAPAASSAATTAVTSSSHSAASPKTGDTSAAMPLLAALPALLLILSGKRSDR